MRKVLGDLLMVLGAVLMVGALCLFLTNRQEADAAAEASAALMAQLVEQLEPQEEATVSMEYPNVPVEMLDPSAFEMTEIVINGHAYIGYLSIPSLGLELPIMSGWDYQKLQIAPCRYYGSVLGRDLVLMAHNYTNHFGRIASLQEGDSVIFTDVDGVVTRYEVVAQDILRPEDVEEMTAGAFDLTLFTCTYGGSSRVTVYCDRTDD